MPLPSPLTPPYSDRDVKVPSPSSPMLLLPQLTTAFRLMPGPLARAWASAAGAAATAVAARPDASQVSRRDRCSTFMDFLQVSERQPGGPPGWKGRAGPGGHALSPA